MGSSDVAGLATIRSEEAAEDLEVLFVLGIIGRYLPIELSLAEKGGEMKGCVWHGSRFDRGVGLHELHDKAFKVM